MTDGTDGKAPSVWIRAVGIIGAVYLVVYGAIGLWRDDLLVSLSKSSGNGVHLHGPLAWLCFAGFVTLSIGIAGLVAPEFGDGEYDMPRVGADSARYCWSGWGSTLVRR